MDSIGLELFPKDAAIKNEKHTSQLETKTGKEKSETDHVMNWTDGNTDEVSCHDDGKWLKCPVPDLGTLKVSKDQSEDAWISKGERSTSETTNSRDAVNGMSNNKNPSATNWERVRKQLKVQLGQEVFESWFGRLKLVSLDGGVVSLSVPTTFLKSWIHATS